MTNKNTMHGTGSASKVAQITGNMVSTEKGSNKLNAPYIKGNGSVGKLEKFFGTELIIISKCKKEENYLELN
jgi:hypothetical protein